MVVFPEGTRYQPDLTKNIQKSQQFARDQGLCFPLFSLHVLAKNLPLTLFVFVIIIKKILKKAHHCTHH